MSGRGVIYQAASNLTENNYLFFFSPKCEGRSFLFYIFLANHRVGRFSPANKLV